MSDADAIKRFGSDARMSQAVVYGGVAYLSGQVALAQRDAGVAKQTHAVLAQIDARLAEAGTDKRRLLSATIWLTDLAEFAEVNAIWEAWLARDSAPARAGVGAALALPGLKVEIAVVAAV